MRFARRDFLAAAASGLIAARLHAADGATRDTALVAPDGREIALRAAPPRQPSAGRAAIVLSHGANGTFDGLGPLVTALSHDRWVFAPLHVDSEDHALHGAVPPAEVWRTRLEDMRLTLDHAVARLGDGGPIVAAGHSYGALVAQALGGATVMGQGARDARVGAVVAISPPGPIPGFIGAEDWAKIAVPMLLTTGTADVLPMIAPTWQAHLASFEATRIARSAAWVGRDVDHYFGRMIQRLRREAPDQASQFEAAMHIVNRYIGAIAEGNGADARWLADAGPTRDFPNETHCFDWRD